MIGLDVHRPKAFLRKYADERPAVPRGLTLSEVYLMEPLDPGAESPPAPQPRGACGLARVSETRLDLRLEHVADVDLERGLQSSEAPGFLGLVRRASFWICQWVAATWPRVVQRHPSPHRR